jgi:hypothetical protein
MRSLLLTIGSLLGAVSADAAADQVLEIKGMTTFDYGVYSGYLDLNEYVDNSTKSLHYVFVES